MATDGRGEDRFEWIGGSLPLDFTNTVTWLPEGIRNERIETYPDLVAWAVQAGVLSDADTQRLLDAARRRPDDALRALERARSVRAIIHALFSDLAHGRTLDPARLREFNAILADTLSAQRISPSGSSFTWEWTSAPEELTRVLAPIVWSAAGLLTSEELPYVRQCANDRCGWLFVDTSRNRSRRWCDMRECGSRAKARRHYQRVRARARAGEERPRQ